MTLSLLLFATLLDPRIHHSAARGQQGYNLTEMANVTMKDIAAKLGVSVVTVSKVLRNPQRYRRRNACACAEANAGTRFMCRIWRRALW